MTTIDHLTMANCLSFEGETLATGSPDKFVRIWNLNHYCCTSTLEGHAGGVDCLQIDTSRDILVSGARDGTLKVWNFKKPRLLSTLADNIIHTVNSLQFDSSTLISGHGDGTIRVWDMHTGLCVRTLHGHTKFVSTLQFRDKQLISGAHDSTIKMWDIGSPHPEYATLQTCSVEKLQWKGDMLIASDASSMFSYSLATNTRLLEYQGHTHLVRSLQFKKNMIISTSDDRTLKVWDLTQAKVTSNISTGLNVFKCLQLDDHRLICGATDRTVRILNFL